MIDQMFPMFVGRALADATDIKLTLPPSITLGGDTGLSKLWSDIWGITFAFLAAMAFVGIIYSGVMMITAGGDATKFAAGKKNLLWSIIGIIIIVMSYFILIFIKTLTSELIE